MLLLKRASVQVPALSWWSKATWNFNSRGIDDTGFCEHYTYAHNLKILIKIIQVLVMHAFNLSAWKAEASGSL